MATRTGGDHTPFVARLLARAHWPREPRWLVACSGGPDSLALLALAARARPGQVVAAHVDHGLRAESASEVDVVRAAAHGFGVPAITQAIELGPGGNLEARARRGRYGALEEMRVAATCDVVLTAHTLDDQAETVLLAMLRGAGSTGLAGIAPRRGVIVRPFLEVRRGETRELCRTLGLAPIEDPMNDDPSFVRVWLRREVLPNLIAGSDRDLALVLARQAAALRDESELLDALAAEAAGDGPELAVDDLLRLPRAIARRTVRQWLPARVGADAVEGVIELAEGRAVALELPGGVMVRRTAGMLVLMPSAASDPPEPVSLSVPGVVSFGGVEVRVRVDGVAPVGWPDGRSVCVLDADVVGPTITLRTPLAGERFRPLGCAGTKTIVGARADDGVPIHERTRLPVVTRSDGEILWVLGYRVAHQARVTPRTRRYCWMTADIPDSPNDVVAEAAPA